MTPIQVLVAGAGPVGLATAYELTRRGVAVRVIDAASGPAETSRAIATHARTLETYEQMGVLDAMLAAGQRIDGFTMFNNGKRLVRLDADYRRFPTAYPFTLAIEQTTTEAVLRGALADLGVTIEWGRRLTDLTDTPDGVRVVVQSVAESESQTLTVPWLVGCDGGHSTVRKLLELPLVGDSNDTWLLADATVTVDLPRNSIYWVRVGNGTMMLVPLPGQNRWRMLDTVDVSADGTPEEKAARFAAKFARGFGRPVEVGTPTWVSVFTAQQRMVPAMRVGHCLVAGDAAHVHSPASGQGMNTGIQEAYNLAWKLALVAHGHASPALLDSYDAERVPIGRALLASTRQATTLVALRNALAGVALPVFFGIVRNFRPLRNKIQNGILGQMSALLVSYPDSPLTTAGGPAPAPGARLTSAYRYGDPVPAWPALVQELHDVRLSLLVFPGDEEAVATADAAATAHCGWLSARLIGGAAVDEAATVGVEGIRPLADPDGGLAASLGGTPGGWLLVRPDGYVAARGSLLRPAVLRAALARIDPDLAGGAGEPVTAVSDPAPATA